MGVLVGVIVLVGVLIGTHFIPAAHDHGMSQVTAASLLALVGVFDVVGTITSGYLTDRIDPRKLLFFYYLLRGLSLFLLRHKSKYFRWHDSGDIQSLKHLAKIFAVARLTPDVNHWLPTREAWVKPYVGRAPKNLVIRFSMPMVDQEAAASWSHTSTVVTTGRTCPAPDQDNKCMSCRACWDPNVKNVAYGKH